MSFYAPRKHVSSGVAVAAILLALYAPQSWFFLMNYPWSAYRLSWLKIWPVLPACFPVAMIPPQHETLMLASGWFIIALTAGGMFALSRYTRVSVLDCCTARLRMVQL